MEMTMMLMITDDLKGTYFKVLDHGFVSLVDYMGSDEDIARAARTSYGAGTKKTNTDAGLIWYLMRHRHCYRGDMEVLTSRGWIRWDECQAKEVFLIPTPGTRTLHKELLEVEKFDADEELVSFENQRMAFHVTPEHRMWFKGKYRTEFEVVRAGEMLQWGHFDPLQGYKLVEHNGEVDARMQFVGFALGDGSFINQAVSFHLKKERKKQYLARLVQKLGLECTTSKSSTYEDANVYYVKVPWLASYAPKETARTKQFSKPLVELTDTEIRGLFDGLCESDGSYATDRDQIQFSSTSPYLTGLFQALAAFLGIDAHHVRGEGNTRVVAYLGSRTTLEARQHYFSRTYHADKVYCTTSSTGLLMVRGGPDKFAFVCGNSTPFEMVELKFHMKLPIFVARQLVRHRTASLNEYSGRYSLMPMLFYTPEEKDFGLQSTTNKQGRGTQADHELYEGTVKWMSDHRTDAALGYETLVNEGVAKELARIDLPLSMYTEWYWKIDLHNLFHFLGLRSDPHAQWEIRQYSDVLGGLARLVAPLAFDAWLDCEYFGMRLTWQEVSVLSKALTAAGPGMDTIDQRIKLVHSGMSNREVDEFKKKLELLQNPVHGKEPFILDANAIRPPQFFEDEAKAATPKVDQKP